MKKYSELLVYLILIILAGCLSLLLVTDIMQAKAERTELTKPDEEDLKAPDGAMDGPVPIQTAIGVFQDRSDLFSLLVTPKPTPTQPILPTPTPTEMPFAEKWVVRNIPNNKMCQITLGDGKTATYMIGNPVPKAPGTTADYVLEKIEKENSRILLHRKSDNVRKWMSKDGGLEPYTEPPK